jgi:hypothetical protein
MSKLDEIQVKVQKFLSEALGNINVGSDGAIEFPFGSTKVSIKVKELMGTNIAGSTTVRGKNMEIR